MLARVKRGEEINITERGVVIARLVPAEPSRVAHLAAGGKLRLPAVSGRMPRPKGPIRTDFESGELIRQMRDEERY